MHEQFEHTNQTRITRAGPTAPPQGLYFAAVEYPTEFALPSTTAASVRLGSLFPGDEDGPRINPFLIYRNKVATTGFAGDIQNVPCFRGRSFDNAPWVYAASPANMGEYAPIGDECTVADFLDGRCGQYFSYPHR